MVKGSSLNSEERIFILREEKTCPTWKRILQIFHQADFQLHFFPNQAATPTTETVLGNQFQQIL